MAKEKDSDMEIPLDILQFASFPKPEFSVNDFLALNFPGISSEIISNNIACWFSNARQFRSVTTKHPSPLRGWWKWRLVIVTTTWYFNKLPIYRSYVRYPLILGQIQQIRTILGRKIGQIWRSGQFWGNFGPDTGVCGSKNKKEKEKEKRKRERRRRKKRDFSPSSTGHLSNCMHTSRSAAGFLA